MFENQSFNIKKIISAALIEPRENETRIIHYGNNIPRYELVYKLSGEVITHFKGEVFNIRQGMAYIIPKCDDAEYYIERTVPGDCIDIFFDTDTELSQRLYIVDFNENTKISGLFQSLYKLWITKPRGYYFKCMSELYEILHMMLLKSDKYLPNSRLKKIEPGIEFIHNNLYTDINYYEPSQICGISYTYFKKLFIEKFGIPPVKYVNNMRLERSRELLLTNKYSVGETSKMCGFENVYYFSGKFKEKYGLSPTEYKKLNKL